MDSGVGGEPVSQAFCGRLVLEVNDRVQAAGAGIASTPVESLSGSGTTGNPPSINVLPPRKLTFD